MPEFDHSAEIRELGPITVRVSGAFRILGIGRSKLYELISAGEIETIKVGRCTLVLVASLADFVERRRRAPQ